MRKHTLLFFFNKIVPTFLYSDHTLSTHYFMYFTVPETLHFLELWPKLTTNEDVFYKSDHITYLLFHYPSVVQ